MKDISFMRLVKSFFKEASMFLYAAYAPFAFCSFLGNVSFYEGSFLLGKSAIQ